MLESNLMVGRAKTVVFTAVGAATKRKLQTAGKKTTPNFDLAERPKGRKAAESNKPPNNLITPNKRALIKEPLIKGLICVFN